MLEEVSNLLRDFNQSIQEEAKDRKYRFHVKRLIKGHSRGLDSVDEDLDFITDDDDIAVLFTLGDGSKVWALGNVEAVAVARGNVDEKRAVGSGSGSYLASLDADERPLKGVHVDDPKAMFLLRWYQEVDADGTVFKDTNGTETYQNRGCKGYYLPLDNGSYAFEWTSMHQVMTAVHLKPHSSKSRTFTLPAGDKKTVNEALRSAVAAAY